VGFQVTRRKTRTCMVGDRPIGGDHLVAVQTMTKTKTHDVPGTLAQIQGAQEQRRGHRPRRLPRRQIRAWRCPPSSRAARVPIIADIHYAPGLALKALEAGVHCVRINPGNIKLELVQKIVALAKDKGASIRIGVNSGSIMPRKGLEVQRRHGTRDGGPDGRYGRALVRTVRRGAFTTLRSA
jgi:(E)-4-hydroxy-3-methylbut-2-enyl-diphosphate synthase